MERAHMIQIVLLGTILFCIFLYFIVKYRLSIIRFIKKKQVLKFIFTVLVPFVVPLLLTIFDYDEKIVFAGFDAMSLPVVILLWVAAGNMVAQFAIWVKDQRDSDRQWLDQSANYSYISLYEIFKNKNSQLRNAYHDGLKQGMLTDADVPYQIFDAIRKITFEFERTVSHITQIPTKDLDSSFIYRYTYPCAGEKDRKWRWVTGKGSKFSPDLNDFAETTDSTFHYMSNNNVSTLFYNDKTKAYNEQRYLYSYKDHSHKCIGSIVAAKVAFSGNDHKLCEGIIMVNSYGHRFLDKLPRNTEEELSELILDNILPCYRNLLTTELAMLYFRHQAEPTDKTDTQKEDAGNVCPPKKIKLTMKNKAIKCIVASNKKIWTKTQ